MKRTIMLLASAGALAFSPAMAAPGGGGHGGGGGAANHGINATTTVTPNSPTGNGGGYNHSNMPQHETGQPMKSCETLIASGMGSAPGKAAENGHSAFGGTAGDKYAGSQPQNSRNTASVSQYDTACARPH